MAITPLDVDGYLEVEYVALGNTHKFRLWCNYQGTPTPGTEPSLAAHSGSGDFQTLTQVTTLIANAWKPMYVAADHMVSVTAYLLVEDGSLWIYTKTDNTAGTHSAVSDQRTSFQTCLTYLDLAGKKMKFNFFENGETTIYRVTAVGAQSWATWNTAILGHTLTSHLGNYVRSRSGAYALALKSGVSQPNEFLQRKYLYP